MSSESFKKPAQKKKRLFVWIIVVVAAVIIIGRTAAFIIPKAIMGNQKTKQEKTMKDMTTISQAIADYVSEHGTAPSQDGTYDENSNLFVSLTPLYLPVLTIKDQWGNNLLVYCGRACNGKYGITGCGPDDFIIVSLGRDGEMEDWEYDMDGPEKGLFRITKMEDFDKDLAMWNGNWIRAQGSNG